MSVKRLHNYWVASPRPLVFEFKTPSLAVWHYFGVPSFADPDLNDFDGSWISKCFGVFTVPGCRPAMTNVESFQEAFSTGQAMQQGCRFEGNLTADQLVPKCGHAFPAPISPR